MKAFTDEHRWIYGVEPICKVLPIAPSTYRKHAACQRDPQRRSLRQRTDERLCLHIQRIWDENVQAYGVRKVWRQLSREEIAAARCTVERLMKRLGLRGVVRGRTIRTTVSDKVRPSLPLDKVHRQFRASRPNALWVADFTYVRTWQGFVYTAFVIDVFARMIVGWQVSRSARTDFVLNALEQALHARRPFNRGLIHHSDRGVQYVSVRYSERLKEMGIEPSVGTTGDSYDNALAETINGLLKTEVIHRRSWPNSEAVELATLEWVDWFNHRRILQSIGNIPPTEAEQRYYQQQTVSMPYAVRLR